MFILQARAAQARAAQNARGMNPAGAYYLLENATELFQSDWDTVVFCPKEAVAGQFVSQATGLQLVFRPNDRKWTLYSARRQCLAFTSGSQPGLWYRVGKTPITAPLEQLQAVDARQLPCEAGHRPKAVKICFGKGPFHCFSGDYVALSVSKPKRPIFQKIGAAAVILAKSKQGPWTLSYCNKAGCPTLVSQDLQQWQQQPVSEDVSVREQCLECFILCKSFAQPVAAVAREQAEQSGSESSEETSPEQQPRQAPEQLQQQQRRQQQPEQQEQASSSQAPKKKRRMSYDPAKVTSYYEQVHCVSGPCLLVREDEACDKKVIYEIFRANAYRPPASTGTLFQRRPDDRLLDLGAHLGASATWFLWPETSAIQAVTCYEPSASTQAVLRANLGSDPRATLHQSAVVPATAANKTGSVILSIDRWEIDKAHNCLVAVSGAAWLWLRPDGRQRLCLQMATDVKLAPLGSHACVSGHISSRDAACVYTRMRTTSSLKLFYGPELRVFVNGTDGPGTILYQVAEHAWQSSTGHSLTRTQTDNWEYDNGSEILRIPCSHNAVPHSGKWSRGDSSLDSFDSLDVTVEPVVLFSDLAGLAGQKA